MLFVALILLLQVIGGSTLRFQPGGKMKVPLAKSDAKKIEEMEKRLDEMDLKMKELMKMGEATHTEKTTNQIAEVAADGDGTVVAAVNDLSQKYGSMSDKLGQLEGDINATIIEAVRNLSSKYDVITDKLEDDMNDLQRCGVPPDVLNADMTYEGDLVGSQASYTCKSDFRQCGDHMKITCQSTRRWETPSGTCERYRWTDPKVDFWETVPCGGQSKLKLLVTGVPTEKTKIGFAMYSGADILSLASIRFDVGSDFRKIITNSNINSKWGKETRSDIFPFTYQQTFSLEMSLEDGTYHVSGNGKDLSSMKKVLIGGRPDRIKIFGGVSLTKVEMVVL